MGNEDQSLLFYPVPKVARSSHLFAALLLINKLVLRIILPLNGIKIPHIKYRSQFLSQLRKNTQQEGPSLEIPTFKTVHRQQTYLA